MALGMRPGIFGAPPVWQIEERQTPEAEQPQAKSGGFFGQGGAGRAIAGSIGDALLQMSGMRPIYQPMMQQRQEMEYDAQRQQTKRQQDWEDYIKQYEYERANPKPSNAAPYRWESNDGDIYQLDPQTGQPVRVFDDPTPKMNFIPDGMGGGQWVAVPSAAAPAKPVGKLTPIQGGPAAPQPGGFLGRGY